MFRKILLPVDGSQSSLKAARAAGEIARRFESEVTILHVQHLPAAALAASGMAAMVTPDGAIAEALDEAAREALRAARESLGLPGDRVNEKVLLGHPAEVICRAAEQGGCDLIAMGSRGLSEVRAFFLGSVSDKVSHHAPCPVLIVR
jgi:nucleotide-binding universal stress UspA family protein